MARNISQYPTITSPAVGDLLPIWQTASSLQRAITYPNLVAPSFNQDIVQSANFSVLSTHKGKVFQVTTAGSVITATLPAAVSVGDGFYFYLRKVDSGAGSVTTSPVTSPAAFSLATQNQLAVVWTDGTNYYASVDSVQIDGNGQVTFPKINSINMVGTTQGANNFGDNAVTQLTSNSTAVTSNTASGVITSFGAYTTAANTAATAFTVNCTCCAATSVVIADIVSYSGTLITNGLPQLYQSAISNGSFTLQVVNSHASNALNGTLKFGYYVA